MELRLTLVKKFYPSEVSFFARFGMAEKRKVSKDALLFTLFLFY